MNLLLPRPLKREMSCAACGLSARNLCGYGNCETIYCSQDCADDHHEIHVEDCAGFQMVGGEFHEVNDAAELDRLRETRQVSNLCMDRVTHDYLKRKFFSGTRVIVYRNDDYELEGVLTWTKKKSLPYEEINACSKSGGGRAIFEYWLENYHDPAKEVRLQAIPQAVGFWKKMGFTIGESKSTTVPNVVKKAFEEVDWLPMTSFDGDPIKRTPDIDKWLQNYALGLKLMGFFTGKLVYQETKDFAKAVEYIQAHKEEFLGEGTLLMHYEPPKKSKRVKR